MDTVNVVQKRNRPFYQNHWLITNLTLKELYGKYLAKKLSFGSFMALKPFYIRTATTKDIEVCCCKTHLHARWSIKALITCCLNQNIAVGGVTSYDSFFQYIYKDCPTEHTYVSWECSPDKKAVCDHITNNWNSLKENILKQSEEQNKKIQEQENEKSKQEELEKTFVSMQHFEIVETITKKGLIVKRLKAVSTKADLPLIIEFIDKILKKTVHHRNQLRHYRSTVKSLRDHLNTVMVDIDFSENLQVPVKFEPQSLHWSHDQITVH